MSDYGMRAAADMLHRLRMADENQRRAKRFRNTGNKHRKPLRVPMGEPFAGARYNQPVYVIGSNVTLCGPQEHTTRILWDEPS